MVYSRIMMRDSMEPSFQEGIMDDRKYKRLRERMVEDQLQSCGITDPAVLDAMGTVPRHLFVSEVLMDRAYTSATLPIGEGQTISQPVIVGEMTQALGVCKGERILEIGTGSGYQAAVLAELAYRVYTVERIHSLYMKTRKLFDDLRYHNIVTRYSDGTQGWRDAAPFDGIIVTAGGPNVPEVLLSQLGDGGRLVMPVGDGRNQQLVRITREGDSFRQEWMSECRFVPLIGEHGWRE